MALSDARLLSMPCQVLFAGWRSTTDALQRAGWQLSAHEDMDRGRVTIAMRHGPSGLYAVSEHVVYNHFGDYRALRGAEFPPTFVVRNIVSDITATTSEDFGMFRPIDAKPQMMMARVKTTSIKDFALFATPLVRTEEIIVEPATVAGLLEQIKALQAPELAAIRKRNAQRERHLEDQPMPQQRFYAQIMSLVA